MRRFFIAGVGLLNLMVIAGASAQTAPPHAAHHPAEAPKSVPSTAEAAEHNCPMMKNDGAHGMDSAMHSSRMGQTHQMPDGMKHCSEMHGQAVPEKPQQPRQ